MPWFSRSKKNLSEETKALQEIKALLQSMQTRLEVIEATTNTSALTQQLERLIIALSSTSYLAPSRLILEEAFRKAIEQAYDFARDHGMFHAHPPIEIPLGTSGSYLLPLDPTYHYQLMIANPLQPEASATLLIIPRSYAEDYELPRLPNGVQRRAFNVNVHKAPPLLVDTLVLLHQKLWPTMYLIERSLLPDGRVKSCYWRCSETIHNQDLLKFPNYLCLYFDYESEGTTLVTDVEYHSLQLSAPSTSPPPVEQHDEQMQLPLQSEQPQPNE